MAPIPSESSTITKILLYAFISNHPILMLCVHPHGIDRTFSVSVFFPDQSVSEKAFLSRALSQIIRPESLRQELSERKHVIILFTDCQNNLKRIRIAKFHHHLPAHSARGCIFR